MHTIIKDCIYRFISVPNICKAFMDTPIFQRLRDIKQLGLAYKVFPSAVHTRLEHSLGVMYLSGEVIDILKKYVEITDREKELVQLAALYHDTGHMAYSHLLDNFLLDNYPNFPDHEKRSVMALNIANSSLQLISLDEALMVGDMILGNYEGKNKPFLYQIVHNSICGLDVDRFDYLQRDAYHTGMPSFQPDYLIQCIRVDEKGYICFQKKAKTEVEFLYETRKRMFSQVYRHKTVITMENTVKDILPVSGILDNPINNWTKIDDIELLYRLRKIPSFENISNRKYKSNIPVNIFEHCSDITREEIEKTMDKVIFV